MFKFKDLNHCGAGCQFRGRLCLREDSGYMETILTIQFCCETKSALKVKHINFFK